MKIKLQMVGLILVIFLGSLAVSAWLGRDLGYSQGYTEGESTGYTEGESVGYEEGFSIGHSEGYQDGLDSIEDELIFAILGEFFPFSYECHIFPKEDPWDGYTDVYYLWGEEVEFIKRIPLVRPNPTPTPEPTELIEL